MFEKVTQKLVKISSLKFKPLVPWRKLYYWTPVAAQNLLRISLYLPCELKLAAWLGQAGFYLEQMSPYNSYSSVFYL